MVRSSSMSHPLVPCAACSRHVHVTERNCPFCAATLGAASEVPSGPLVDAKGRRLTRASTAMFTTLALACSGTAVVDDGSSAATTTGTTSSSASGSATASGSGTTASNGSSTAATTSAGAGGAGGDSSSSGDGGNIAPPYGLPGGFGGTGGDSAP